jgi:Bacterial Ig domain
MYHFTIKDIDQNSQCIPCCCESLSMKPGSTNKVSVNYAPWAVPIGRLHCLPSFDLEQKDTCVTTGAPVKIGGNPVAFDTPVNTVLSDDLNTKIIDPENGALKFKVLGLYGPKNGVVVVLSDGSFDYTPTPGYEGEDRFFVTATDPTNKSTTFEVLIGVGSTTSVDMTETPHVSVDAVSVNVNYQIYTASFAVKISPAADLCEVWRLTVQMQSIDCECVCFDRTDCFDIRIVQC